MKRRTFLATGLSLSIAPSNLLSKADAAESWLVSSLQREPVSMQPNDQHFLRDLQQRCYQFFIDAAHTDTGFISDRGATDGSWFSGHASSAACGFGLTAHSVAAQNEWVPREHAADRTRQLLRSLVTMAAHENGFVYHFFDAANGKRSIGSEASSIDTALLITGAMTAAMTFSDDAEIVQLADELYRRVDWQWMLGANDLLHMGWTPESGMIAHQWDSFSELIVLVLLAIGAPNSPIPPRCWQAWRRTPVLQHNGEDFISYPPLFVHQYPMAFFDFRNVRSPSGRSYWDNSVRAHHAQIAFMTELGNRYPAQMRHYGCDMWGLTSSDSAVGYRDWGGPYENGRCEPDRDIDGTVVPSAAAGGLAMVPHEALHTLRYQKQHFGDKVYSRYGFVNAYNPATQWVGRDVIGIDTGITLIMAENLLTGGVWEAFMRHPAANRSFKLAGFA